MNIMNREDISAKVFVFNGLGTMKRETHGEGSQARFIPLSHPLCQKVFGGGGGYDINSLPPYPPD